MNLNIKNKIKILLINLNVFPNLLNNWEILNNVPFSLIFVNFFFQRIIGVNRKCRFPIHFTSYIVQPEKLMLTGIGKDIVRSICVSGNCYFQANNGILIGDGTLLAPGVKIISSNHDRENYKSFVDSPPIKIENNCWIGSNVVILPGVHLGPNTIVGAGSIVTRSFPEGNVTIKGVPAKCKKI